MCLSFNRIIPVLLLTLFAPVTHAADDDLHWWTGFSMTPGVGARHLGLDITRKSDGETGNISQAGAAQLFASLSVSTPVYPLGESKMWGVAVRMYSSFVTLDHQWYDYHTGSSTTGSAQGERVNVGTEVSGYYTYIIPTIGFYGGGFAMAAGVGLWDARLSGDIILTPDDNPAKGMPADKVSFTTHNKLAYMVTMSYTTRNAWLIEMTVGGTQFSDSDYDYELEEVALIVGKTFTF